MLGLRCFVTQAPGMEWMRSSDIPLATICSKSLGWQAYRKVFDPSEGASSLVFQVCHPKAMAGLKINSSK